MSDESSTAICCAVCWRIAITETIGAPARHRERERVLEADPAFGLAGGHQRLGRRRAVGQDLEVDPGVAVPAVRLGDVEPGVVRVGRPVEREPDRCRATAATLADAVGAAGSARRAGDAAPRSTGRRRRAGVAAGRRPRRRGAERSRRGAEWTVRGSGHLGTPISISRQERRPRRSRGRRQTSRRACFLRRY